MPRVSRPSIPVSRFRFRLRHVLIVFAALLVGPWAAEAQGLFALGGTVRDADGVVPGATVVISTSGAEISTTTTDGTGAYRFADLPPGGYQLAYIMRGFETVVRNVVVGANTSPVDVVLSVGRVSTTLTVTAAAGRTTASRLPVPNDDIPAQVSSVPQELMRQQGTNTVAEALRNVSGVQAVRWYGAYEQYTIRGFFDPDRDAYNTVLIDGMRLGGNRYGTQTNTIQSIEVLKGPSSVLYGRGAVGGTINLIRKKPEAARSYELAYTGGRFNSHQVSFGATGPVGGSDRLLYRLDASFETSDGWRDAGANRLNLAPSLTWVMSPKARLTVHQNVNRDSFDGDGGVPFNVIPLATFKAEDRFSLPQDNVLVEDSRTHVSFSANLSPRWELRNNFLMQRTSDRYFVTEGVYGDPENNLVSREPLDFHHIRRPYQNQAEVVGRFFGFGRHTVLVGYEYQRDKYRTEVTAGDDPECLCGYWWRTITPMDITTLAETQPAPLDLDTVERTTFVNDEIHAFYWQDQIDLLPKLKVNVAGRFDDYRRRVNREGGLPFTPQVVDQTAYTYRAGLVYELPQQQIYFGTSSSFTPETTVPEDGTLLDPSTARNYEAGHRWRGWRGRLESNVAAYFTVRNNLAIRETVTTVRQIGEQTARGLDVDVNAELGAETHLIFNYGYVRARFGEAEELTGLTPRFVPANTANVWLRKDWRSGFNASVGLTYVGNQFVTDRNMLEIDDYTLVSGAIGYRANRWEWSLNSQNLLNKGGYYLPGHFSNQVFPGPPISVNTTMRLRLN